MIEYLKINNEKIPVRLNRRAIVCFEKKYNKSLTQLGELKTDELIGLVWLGVIEGYRFLEQDFKHDEDSFNDLLDDLLPTELYEKLGNVIADFFQAKEKKGKK